MTDEEIRSTSAVRSRKEPRLRQTLTRAVVLDVSALLPVGLVGALGVLVVADVGAPDAAGGVLVGTFFLAGSSFLLLGGSLIDRMGWKRAAIGAQSLIAVALLVCAGAPGSWVWLVLGLGLAGVGSSVSQPSTSVIIARHVQEGRRGFALSGKLAAVPAALLIAGLAVPVLGQTLGWRSTFLAAALLPVLCVLLVVTFRAPAVGGPSEAPPERGGGVRAGLLVAGAGMLLGAMLPGVVLAFMVPSMVDVGLSIGQAGVLLAVCNVLAILSRVAVAVRADSPAFGGYRIIAIMMALGGLGCLLVAVPTLPTILIGAVLAFSMGWGWAGQSFFLALRTFPDEPGAAVSVIQSSGMFGSALGPYVGALGVYVSGLGAAWVLAAVTSFAGAALLLRLPTPPRVTVPDLTAPTPEELA